MKKSLYIQFALVGLALVTLFVVALQETRYVEVRTRIDVRTDGAGRESDDEEDDAPVVGSDVQPAPSVARAADQPAPRAAASPPAPAAPADEAPAPPAREKDGEGEPAEEASEDGTPTAETLYK